MKYNIPLVSIVMPCFNDGLYIMDSIDSAFAQSYENLELIIVNDGSTDPHTIDVLARLCDPRITVFNGERKGPAAARNMAIKHSKGKYILPLDSDDLISVDYIKRAVEIIENNPQIGVVYCRADLFGEKSGPWDLPDYSFEKMLLDNVVFVTSLFRKEDWERVGGFSPELEAGMEDYDFWISLLEIGLEVHQIPEILFHYRIKPQSRTSHFQKSTETVKDTYRKIYQRHPIFYEKHKDEYAVILRDALIEQIHAKSHLEYLLAQKIPLYERLSKIKWLKKIIKKGIRNKVG